MVKGEVYWSLHWDIHPARVHIVAVQACEVTIPDWPDEADLYTRKFMLYCVRTELHTWYGGTVIDKGLLMAPELHTRSKAVAMVAACRLRYKLARAGKIKYVLDLENEVYDLIEEMGGDTSKYPSTVDLDKILKCQRGRHG